MHYMQQAFRLAQKMGKSMGRSEILLGQVPRSAIIMAAQ
jgi:hypothetical protein